MRFSLRHVLRSRFRILLDPVPSLLGSPAEESVWKGHPVRPLLLGRLRGRALAAGAFWSTAVAILLAW